MEIQQINITRRMKTSKGWRFYPVVLANGRVQPGFVMIEGREVEHPEGEGNGGYYLDWTEPSEKGERKRVRIAAGKTASEAQEKREYQQKQMAFQQAAKEAGVKVPAANDNRRRIQTAIEAFLNETEANKKPATLKAYKTDLGYFAKHIHKGYLEEIDRHDMLTFKKYLKDKGLSDRSIANKFLNVCTFLNSQGISARDDLDIKKGDRPVVVEEEVEIYEQDELDKFFAACDPEQKLWFEFFLYTGMREKEVMHCIWRNVNYAAGTISVKRLSKGVLTAAPHLEWTPKAYHEREIPVPKRLLDSLKKFQAEGKANCPLIFPTSGCRPKSNFLDECKDIARRAGLNCGHCATCKTGRCEHWFLHKFRATFGTTCLRNGVDLRTVQHWMGHKDLESTMRYLKPHRGEEARKKVEAVWAAASK